MNSSKETGKALLCPIFCHFLHIMQALKLHGISIRLISFTNMNVEVQVTVDTEFTFDCGTNSYLTLHCLTFTLDQLCRCVSIYIIFLFSPTNNLQVNGISLNKSLDMLLFIACFNMIECPDVLTAASVLGLRLPMSNPSDLYLTQCHQQTQYATGNAPFFSALCSMGRSRGWWGQQPHKQQSNCICICSSRPRMEGRIAPLPLWVFFFCALVRSAQP